jgi:hypothetical protein
MLHTSIIKCNQIKIGTDADRAKPSTLSRIIRVTRLHKQMRDALIKQEAVAQLRKVSQASRGNCGSWRTEETMLPRLWMILGIGGRNVSTMLQMNKGIVECGVFLG